MHNGVYFEIDIFPFWKDKAIMEVELKNENEEISLPNFIKIIKEVSEDENYKNHSLARI
jgi:CYTH domain-containing protein